MLCTSRTGVKKQLVKRSYTHDLCNRLSNSLTAILAAAADVVLDGQRFENRYCVKASVKVQTNQRNTCIQEVTLSICLWLGNFERILVLSNFFEWQVTN